jgi:hypothetical protein
MIIKQSLVNRFATVTVLFKVADLKRNKLTISSPDVEIVSILTS